MKQDSPASRSRYLIPGRMFMTASQILCFRWKQRVLGSMLPDVRGLDVLDAGCGTGRWLQQLADRSPRSLLGVDISPQMLLLAGFQA